jgi:hypothetical protein
MRKLAVSLSDSTELRVILSVLYIMTEVLRNHENEALREGFKSELSKTWVKRKNDTSWLSFEADYEHRA